jgi:CHAT domain-containing protein
VSLDVLEYAPVEVEGVVVRFPHSVHLPGDKATRDAVVEAIPTCDVVHFACHGIADTNDPMQSHLVMAEDIPLSLEELLDVVGLDRVRLAVLSACETNIPSDRLPDEATSLAVGLLFAAARRSSAPFGACSTWRPPS